MSLTEEPYYMKRDCSPVCNHREECARCHNPRCVRYMHHNRLHGYMCDCGSQEWKPVFVLPQAPSGLTKRAADLAVCTTELHKQLDDQGFRFCGYCGQPLSR